MILIHVDLDVEGRSISASSQIFDFLQVLSHQLPLLYELVRHAVPVDHLPESGGARLAVSVTGCPALGLRWLRQIFFRLVGRLMKTERGLIMLRLPPAVLNDSRAFSVDKDAVPVKANFALSFALFVRQSLIFESLSWPG